MGALLLRIVDLEQGVFFDAGEEAEEHGPSVARGIG
jgi:hypothetical protein